MINDAEVSCCCENYTRQLWILHIIHIIWINIFYDLHAILTRMKHMYCRGCNSHISGEYYTKLLQKGHYCSKKCVGFTPMKYPGVMGFAFVYLATLGMIVTVAGMSNPIVFVPGFTLLGLALVIYVVATFRTHRFWKMDAEGNLSWVRRIDAFAKTEQAIRSDVKVKGHGSSIFVHSIGSSFPICCYNTARLGEGYCLCGKAIPQSLQEMFVDQFIM